MIDNSLLHEHQRMDNQINLNYNNISELLLKKVQETPNKPFLIFPGKKTNEFTYSEFKSIVEKTAIFFKQIGLKKNDRISIVFHNSPEFLVLYYAGLSIGLAIVPINPDITSVEIRFIIENSKSHAIFYSDGLELKINDIKNYFNDIIFKKIKSINDIVSSINDETNVEEIKTTLYDLAVIIYTSGTTGNPKGVELTHLNLLSMAMGLAKWFKFDTKTRCLCILPLFHNNGQIVSVLSSLYTGGSIIIVKGKVSLYSFWDLIYEYQVTWVSVMASILSILLSLPKERRDSTLMGIICGGQILTQSIQNDFEKRFCVPICEGYGLTETTSFSCLNDYPAEKRKFGSIGKALEINEMVILNENDEQVGIDVEGQICIRGYNVTRGYLGLIKKNKDAFRNGWFHSGDFGRKDKDGYYYIHGRRDFMIIKGGENIYPAELENVLYQHPYVDECAVIGIPDKLLGEEICAFVKCKDDNILNENDLKVFCKGKIAAYKQAKKIIIINNLVDLDDVPKGPTKKVLYRKLKNYYLENFQK